MELAILGSRLVEMWRQTRDVAKSGKKIQAFST